ESREAACRRRASQRQHDREPDRCLREPIAQPGPWSAWLAQICHRVHRTTVNAHFEVKVRCVGASGGARIAEQLTTRYLRSLAHHDCGLVSVDGRETAAMIDDDDVAVRAERTRGDDYAGSGRTDRMTIRRSDVDSRM